jgi:DNA polymerase (family 10)
MRNPEIAALLDELADRQQVEGESPFRLRAYRSAAKTIRSHPVAMERVAAAGELQDIPGIGEAIAQKIRDALQTGTFPALERARATVPDPLLALTRVPGVGGATARKIWDAITETTDDPTFEDIVRAAQVGNLEGIPKVGPKLIAAIAEAEPAALEEQPTLMLRSSAQHLGEHLADVALECGAEAAEQVGEYRRGAELIEHVDMLVLAGDPGVVERSMVESLRGAGWEHFGEYAIAPNGTEVRFHFGAPDRRDQLFEQLAGPTAPGLVEVSDLHAELHCHSNWTDGRATIEQMARAAAARGDTFIAITDHSAPYAMVGGLDGDDLRRQAEEIEQVRARLAGEVDIEILRGIELEINADGTLGLPDDVLEELDWVVASVHMGQQQDRDRITARVENALRNPHVDCIAHPTSRLLLKRPPTQLDIERVIELAVETGTALEINANPDRLDLSAEHARMALAAGVPLAINSDAHGPDTLWIREHGVAIARAAGAAPEQVMNCWSLERVRQSCDDRAARQPHLR